MSIIEKLFGKKVVQNINNALQNAANQINGGQKPEQPAQPQQHGGMTIGATVPHYEPAQDGPSGDSWGPNMPAEPNQFNYSGTWFEYFNEVFREEFPTYRIVSDRPREKYAMFTFYRGEQVALVVELLAQSSAAEKVRRDCRRAGTPYLRYYYDHEGWWNTRSYVTRRTSAALER